MKRIFNRIKQKISTKEERPPPYDENDAHPIHNNNPVDRDFNVPDQGSSYEVLDLLANCKVTADDNLSSSEVEYAEIEEMGVWHSTPLPGRHKSKISLTWILKENMESTKNPIQVVDKNKPAKGADASRYQRHNKKFNENERQRNNSNKRAASKDVRERVVGRSEIYNRYRYSACEVPCAAESCSEGTSAEAGDHTRRRHRHKHRKRKSKLSSQSARFGYDIRDVDCFLSEASIEHPGNIPVVVAYPSTLYQTQGGGQVEMQLPLGTVVNAVFKNKQWLYVQTPHADEGYIMYSACLPLGILPKRTNSPQKNTPCWESSTDIYPRPCGNLTDNEKEQLRGRTRSECRYRGTSNGKRKSKNTKSLCGEEEFDTLYLKTKSFTNVNQNDAEWRNTKESEVKELRRRKPNVRNSAMSRHTLLVVNRDFVGSSMNNTLSVHQGDVVVLIQGNSVQSDVDCHWFFVRRKDGKQGFIPAEIAGHGYI